jgi:class 3 adenylate cyclase
MGRVLRVRSFDRTREGGLSAEPRTDRPRGAQRERKVVSVLFVDLVGFTPLSERLEAEDVATIRAIRTGVLVRRLDGGPPDPDALRPGVELASWMLGVETVVGSWIAA